uniref:PFU domain-containing protein n=1 Tax=Kwoniella bestiolae CBS 10118 TaxID=1296100 RepID=A0A1B9G744_9TREE|nr:hypothetical protein I302_04538 [Kwoniella bestiolae CBS 10118]OCF26848.1 hypothetical protein I302_04538 [Kwoniella bestiolae CBS 10118]
MTAPQGGSHPYDLSCILDPPHLSDVKAVLAISNDMIASASRDSSVGIWTRVGQSKFELKALLDGHHAYVNSLAYIPSTDESDDLLASGGNSSLILLHSLRSLSPESQHCLVGHSLNVCTMSYSRKTRKLISGSWDQTARVWSKSSGEWDCETVLEGHDQAVWGVAIIDEGPKEGCYLTADRMIFLWNQKGEVLQRFKGSPEPVRSLAILPGGETFASACNDNLIRIWNFEGSVVGNLKGHTDYVYQVVPGVQGVELVSCGEDHTARAWTNGKNESVLLHPCQTVWSVSCLSNGDIVTGGSDGGVRIWTRASDRLADQDIRDAYMEVVKEKIPSPQPDNNNRDQSEPASLTIDIDLSDDDLPIPLVFQIGSDPRATAEAFGQEHGLSDNYINQIEAFIKAHLEVANP